jgi:uncharacterized membrane protein
MSWYEFLLFVHVACAAIWVGGGFVFQVYGMVVRKAGDPLEMAQFSGRAGVVGERLFTPASLLVLLAGIGLMIEGNWSWGDLWVIFALAGFAGSFVNGLFLIAPMAKKLPAVGPETAAGQELIARIFTALRVELVVLFAIVFAMTVKPTTDDGWTVLVSAAVVAGLSGLFVVRSRTPRAEVATQSV